MSDTEEEYIRHFKSQLIDSIIQLEEAEEADSDGDREYGETMSRASIMASLLLLETTANTCLELLDLEKSVHDEVDRLPLSSKFDFFLRTRFRNRKLDRSMRQFQILRELVAVRNLFVHPKTKSVIWNVEPTGEDGQILTADHKRTKVLSIDTNPEFWSHEDALAVMCGTHELLNFFFKDQCKFRSKQVASLIFSRSKVPTLDWEIYECITRETLIYLRKKISIFHISR